MNIIAIIAIFTIIGLAIISVLFAIYYFFFNQSSTNINTSPTPETSPPQTSPPQTSPPQTSPPQTPTPQTPPPQQPKPSTIGIYNGSETLNLSQIALFDTNGNNIKINEADLTASDSNSITTKIKAIDGNNLSRAYPEIYHSGDKNAFYEIKLPYEKNIGKITLFNRSDCCPERLETYSLIIKNDKKEIIASIKLNKNLIQTYNFDGKTLTLV
jgi:hypothetical protein